MKKSRTILSQTWQTVLAGFLAAAISASSPALADDYTIDGTGGGATSYATLQDLHTAMPNLDGENSVTWIEGAAEIQTLGAAFRATTDEDEAEDEFLMLKCDLDTHAGTIAKAEGVTTRFITNEDGDFLRLVVFRDDDDVETSSEFTISGFNGTSDGKGGAFFGGTVILGARNRGLTDVEPAVLTWKNNSVAFDSGDGSVYGGALYVVENLYTWGDRNVFVGNEVHGDTNTSGGGAIHVGNDMNLGGILEFRDNKVVLENSAEGSMAVGGAIFVSGGNATIDTADAIFENNTVQGDYDSSGGALAVKGNLAIYGSAMNMQPKIVFIGNKAEAADPDTGNDNYASGGAVFVLTGTTTIGHDNNPIGAILFEGNKANGINTPQINGRAFGGALASDAISGLSVIQKAVFKDNEAKGVWNAEGGAINFNSILTLHDNIFEGNIAESTFNDPNSEHHAYASGGAVSTRNSLTLTGTNTFTGNKVITPQYGKGGAIEVLVAQGRDYSTGTPMLTIGGSATFAGNEVLGIGSGFGGAISTAYATTVSGATFEANRVIATGISTGYIRVLGGAIEASSGITLEGWNQFTGNRVEATNGQAFGGALYVDRTAFVLAGSQEVVIRGTSATDVTTFSSNRAVTTADGGMARGGAIAIMDGKAATMIDAQFVGNSAEATRAGNALGGAIYTTGDLAITAENQNVVFQFNRTKAGETETPNDIHLVNVNITGEDPDPILSLNAVVDREIVLGGGVTGVGDIVVNDHNPVAGGSQFGTVDFAETGTTIVEGNFNVKAGTLKTAVVTETAAGAGPYKSNVFFRQWENEEGENEGGLVEIAADVTWTVDTSDVENGRREKVTVGEGGWVSSGTTGADARLLAQEALDRGNTMYFGLLTAGTGEDGEAVLGVDTTKVHVSDVFVNTLLMHAANTMRNSVNGRIDHNFERFVPATVGCGSVRSRKTCCLGPSLWGNFVGRNTELDGKTYSTGAGATWQKAKITSAGVQVGADLLATDQAQFGLMVGGENSWNRLGSFDEVKADDYYFGLYGAFLFDNGFDVRGLFGGGFQKYDMKRLQTLGTAADRGVFNSRFSGKTFEGTLEIGRRFHLRRSHLSFRPVLGFDVFNNAVNGTVEYGGSGNEGLTFGNMSLTQMFIRTGSDIQWTRDRLNLNGGLYYSYDLSSNGHLLRSRASQGETGNVVLGSDLGRSVFSFNVGANYYLNHAETVSLFGNYFGDYFTDRDGKPLGHTAIVGVQVRF